MYVLNEAFFVAQVSKSDFPDDFEHVWALFYRDTFAPVLFVDVSEHVGSPKYRDKSIGASSTCFLPIITVPLY